MDLDFLQRFFTDLVGRTDGPMSFRFILQPAMAALTAWHDGTRDAKEGRQPYAWQMEHEDGSKRAQSLWEGVRSMGRVLVLGVVIDVIYQVRVFGGFRYPNETIVIVLVLAFLPYLLLRGPVDRFQRARMTRKGGP